MTDRQQSAEVPGWEEILASFEGGTPEDLIAIMPGTETEKLIEDFPDLASVSVLDHELPGSGGPIPVRSYRIEGAQAGSGLVWIHGGGFIFGHLDMDEAHWVSLAIAARGIPVVSVDYRKCLHGVHYPAPLDDVLEAWFWSTQHAEDLGMIPGQVHIGGASAGACLAAGVTKRLRDGAVRMPVSVVLAYAVLHSELPEPSNELLQALDRMHVDASRQTGFLEQNYAGSQEASADPYAFASNGDVSGQPPVYVLNSEADLLRASGEAYADQLQAAGVQVRVEFEPNTIHGHLNEPYSAEGQRSIERIVQWISDESVRPTSN
jgi:acetyl esterase/lipase